MRIPLLRGREFTEQDTGATRVAIVNSTMARRFWPNVDPLGKRFGSRSTWYTIVGVVGDVKFTSLAKDADPEFYEPYRQTPIADMVLALRSASDPAPLAAALRESVRGADPTQAISRITTMGEYLSDRLGEPRLSALLFVGFGVTALLLAAIGIYGVISFSVTRRTREIGIRIALGAARREVMWLAVGEAVLLASIGVAVGIAAALSLTRVMQGMLFGVSATEPLVYVAVSALLIATGAFAAYLPALRATRITPSLALRCD
jgi:putative ABC transport system permease protein